MLKKLLKYEFRATARTYGGMYLALLAASVLFGGSVRRWNGTNSDAYSTLVGLLSLVYTAVIIGTVVVTIMTIVQRFYRNLLGREGYLMHTLPVRSWQLVLSKLICALATTVVNGIVGILAMFLMMPLNWDEIFDTQLWQAVFRNLAQQPDIILYFLEFLLLLLVMCAAMFMNFYLAMSIGHLFSRRRILMSVVAFFGLNILDSVITSTLHNMDMMNWLYGMDLSDHAGYWLGILLLLIPTVIMFLLTSWILKHKLNLE